MYLAKVLWRELENPELSLKSRALLRCRLAKQLEQAGDYDGAAEAMDEFWFGVGVEPALDDLDDETRAEILLRLGVLSGWIGDADSQESAKDLISKSARLFDKLGRTERVGEAHSDLALCYWRAGAYDEARVTLNDAMSHFGDRDVELKAVTLVRQAIVERSSTRLHDALIICTDAAPLFDDVADPLLAAHFHHIFANVLNQLSSSEHRKDYKDRALVEYSAASLFFAQAGHFRYQACTYINLGILFFTLNKFSEAHENLDRAQVLLTKLKDNIHLAQVDETRARVLLAEDRIVEAEKTVRAAVQVLEHGGKVLWLVEALTTHGIALARLSHPDQSRAVLERAINVAEQAGDFENAGIAALTIIEHFSAALTTVELSELIDRTKSLLEKTQDINILRRLARAAFQVLFLVQAAPAPTDWNDFSLREAVRRFERGIITRALSESGGSVTTASRLLGLRHHQSLINLLDTRHKDLLNLRAEKRQRHKHLMQHPKRTQKKNK
jgi:tetratricopeptide (TPR) repeat protein